jgi:hypothetical protein
MIYLYYGLINSNLINSNLINSNLRRSVYPPGFSTCYIGQGVYIGYPPLSTFIKVAAPLLFDYLPLESFLNYLASTMRPLPLLPRPTQNPLLASLQPKTLTMQLGRLIWQLEVVTV